MQSDDLPRDLAAEIQMIPAKKRQILFGRLLKRWAKERRESIIEGGPVPSQMRNWNQYWFIIDDEPYILDGEPIPRKTIRVATFDRVPTFAACDEVDDWFRERSWSGWGVMSRPARNPYEGRFAKFVTGVEWLEFRMRWADECSIPDEEPDFYAGMGQG